MCLLCKEIKQQVKTKGAPLYSGLTAKYLALISSKLQNTKNYEHFDEVTNLLLGTEMSERNSDIEESWERAKDGS